MKLISRGILLPLIGFLLLQGCDNKGLIGLEDQQFANGKVVDSLTVLTETMLVPRTRTDNNLIINFSGYLYNPINYRSVGYFKDPVFGATEARTFTQVFSTGGHFGENPVLDSAVLVLRYPAVNSQGSYGDTLDRVNIVVEELSEELIDSVSYYSDQLFQTGAQIGSGEFIINRKDSIELQAFVNDAPDSTVLAPPQLRIKLDPAYITSKFLQIDTAILNDQADFINYFKGISLRTDSGAVSGNGALMSFNLASEDASEIRLYYRTNNNADTLSKSFPITQAASQASYLHHDYSGTAIAGALENDQEELLYIQGLQGLQTKVSFPYLHHLADSGMVNVNKAELVLNVEPGSDLHYYPSPKLMLHQGPNDQQFIKHIPDSYINAEVGRYFSGVYQEETRSYRFNITHYVQALLNEEADDDSLYLGILNTIYSPQQQRTQLIGSVNDVSRPSRVVVGSGRHPEYRARLEVVYSK